MACLVSTLLPQLGAHPISTNIIHFPSQFHLPKSCTLHVYFSLPPVLFLDTYELSQRNSSYSFEHWGTRDLERPVHALPEEESELLINVKVPEGLNGSTDDDEGTIVRVEVPMHLRYGRPRSLEDTWNSQGKPYQHVTVDWPQAFLQCPSAQSHSASTPPTLPPHILATSSSKSDSVLISIPPHTNFSDTPQNILSVPLGNPQDIFVVELVTALTIIVCFFWLLRVSWKVAVRLDTTSGRPKTA